MQAPLRLTILSHSDTYYSTRRLQEAATAQGLLVSRVDPVRVVLRAHPTPAIFEDALEIPPPDILLPRIGASLVHWSTQLVDAWRARGVLSPLTGRAIATAADKLATAVALSGAGLRTVPTVALREPFHASQDLLSLFGTDHSGSWVLKRTHGTGGQAVALAPDDASAVSFAGTLVAERTIALVQPFVKTVPTRDIRIIMAGYEPLAACFRVAAEGEFRANVHRGARPVAATEADLPEGTFNLAVAAARALELPFGGIDIIETPDGPAILEVNASPGFQGIEEAHGWDVAGAFISRLVASAAR